jgi:hypothetical protein
MDLHPCPAHPQRAQRSVRVPRRRPPGRSRYREGEQLGRARQRPRTATTTTITHTIGLRHSLTADGLDAIDRTAWEGLDPDDHDELAVTTAVTEADAATDALAHLVEVFSADDLAPALRCIEADAIADVLRTQGAAGAAHRWIRHHATADEPGDTHHSPAPLAPAEYVVPVDPHGNSRLRQLPVTLF